MTDLFSKNSMDKTPLDELFVVYVLFFDEARGHLPLVIYPIEIEKFKESKRFMRPIKYHSIWFMPVEEVEALDHVDLEYKGYTFFGKKFLTKSKRKKRRAGLEEETPETIVIIVSLPNDIAIFGDEFIRVMKETIRDGFEDKLFKIIESEIAKDEVIKTVKVKKTIEEGNSIKERLVETIAETSKEYFSNAIRQADTTSIKKQKAIAYLSLRGFDIARINSLDSEDAFSNIKIFDIGEKAKDTLKIHKPKWIFDVNIAEDSQELEILVRNNSDDEYQDLRIKITHIKEFFEQEIMNQTIDIWFPQEELVFISPIIPYIKEYLFFIYDKDEKQKLVSKKIDLNILGKVKN